MRHKQTGFTLIELLIAIAVVGILASVAYPSYTNFVLESNRTEGQRELLRVANLMEQYYLDNRTYTQDMEELGLGADPFITTEGELYSIDSTDADNDGYTLRATALGAQASRDKACSVLVIDDAGKKSSLDSESGYSSNCWE